MKKNGKLMENGLKALILVDYTVDFVAADGKLTVGEPGRQIEAAVAEKIKAYADAGHLILAVNDLHDAHDTHHPEHELFPPHNLAGTEGRNLYGGIEGLLKRVELEYPGQVFRLDKRRYSAFCGTPLELILRQERIQDLELAGVCTDICILHTAIEAYNKGFRVHIDEEAVASFNETAHRTALDHFESVLGFQVKRRG